MAQKLPLDQIDTASIQALDSSGNPVPFTPDSPPVWTNSNPAAATSAVSADGLTNVLTPVAGAIDQVTTVTVTAIIAGVTFSASADYTIVAGASGGGTGPTVASIQIVDALSPAPAAPIPAPVLPTS